MMQSRVLIAVIASAVLIGGCTSDPQPDPDERQTLSPAPSVSNPLGECARNTTIGLLPSQDAVDHQRGAQMAVDLLNQRGSFFYELDVREGDPNDAVGAFIAGDVSAVIGELTRTQADFLQNARLTTLALTEAQVVDTVGDAIFRLALTDIETVAEATSSLIGLENYHDIALFAAGSVPARIAARSFEDVDLATSNPGAAVDAGGDAVAVVTTPGAAQGAVDGLVAEGHRGATILGPASSDAATSDLDGRVFLAAPWDADSPLDLNQDFVADHSERFGEPPSIDAAYAYSAVILIARAVEEACSNDRGEVRSEMARTDGATTLMGRFSFTRSGGPRHQVLVFEVRRDELVPVGLTPG